MSESSHTTTSVNTRSIAQREKAFGRQTMTRWKPVKNMAAGGAPEPGGDKLTNTVNALRAALRFKAPDSDEDPDTLAELFAANSYRLDPEPEDRFRPSTVENLMRTILERHLAGYRYDRDTAGAMSTELSGLIMEEVKNCNFARYKIICNVMVGQTRGQSVKVASRSLWNSSSDSFASAEYKTTNFFAVATVHATYYE